MLGSKIAQSIKWPRQNGSAGRTQARRRAVPTLIVALAFLSLGAAPAPAQKPLTDYVNPLLGTATLWDAKDIGYVPSHRTWGAEVFPGASLPNAMVQVSPVTQFRSGSGYQYEDPAIQALTHTCKGHWNLCHVPILPATGAITPDDYGSPFSHTNESAHPGYYQVYLERYRVNAELTATLRCAFHRYTFEPGADRKLIVDLSRSNEQVRDWDLARDGERAFKGFQRTGEKLSFYAESSHRIAKVDAVQGGSPGLFVIEFAGDARPLELRIGFSFVNVTNAKANLEHEMLNKSFSQVRKEATDTWEKLLSRIQVTGGTERERGIFYSCLYRSFLWPALRSDANGDFATRRGQRMNKGFRYYTEPSLWDDYRNKLVLLGILSPDVSVDVIRSLIDRGERTGFMPTFFHGDHAAAYIAGACARGLRGFDVKSAYNLLLRNATVEGGTRPFITEYIAKGYISDPAVEKPDVETKAKAGVTKTLEYAYDDYAVAQLARALNDTTNYALLMQRSGNFTNLFDPSTGLMRGRLANGDWITPFDPLYPYYEYMYREANAWQSSFFAPHNPRGLIALYPSPAAFEKKLDEFFSIPWNGVEAYNFSVFIGQYCHGNQPDHGFPFMYYFVGKQEKAQAILDRILDHFYDMGTNRLAYAGMDDAGEMSSWYVFNAIGLYPFSPADADYIVTVPLFERVKLTLENGTACTISRGPRRTRIKEITYDGRKVEGYLIPHQKLLEGKELRVVTE
jgi:predicted alpha-1,2-mannosidase